MHVVITGASSGIGEAIAREYFRRGADVTLVARRKELLEKLGQESKAKVNLVQADLSIPAQMTSWVAEAEAVNGPIDVLINNAGVQIVQAFSETEFSAAEKLLTVDLVAPLKLSQTVVRGMIARRRGVLVDIASMAAIAPTPGMAFYNAAKGGLAAYSEALRAELKPHGIHVVTVYPGPVATAMEVAGRGAYEESAIAKLLTPIGKADVLARRVAKAVENKRARVIYPGLNVFARWFPAITRMLLDAFTPKLRQ
jgi:short-subunit dehydrogenase